MAVWHYLLPFAFGALCGSVPFGFMVGRLRGVDVRREGSGNIGATNVARSAGWFFGVVVFLLDVAKGVLPVWLGGAVLFAGGGWSYHVVRSLCGAGAIAGHVWTPWLKFKGGKGVATSFGVFTAILGPWVLGAVLVWRVVVGIWKYVSLGSLAAGVSVPLLAVAQMRSSGDMERGAAAVVLSLVVMVVLFVRHRENIARLLDGEEARVGRKKEAGESKQTEGENACGLQ